MILYGSLHITTRSRQFLGPIVPTFLIMGRDGSVQCEYIIKLTSFSSEPHGLPPSDAALGRVSCSSISVIVTTGVSDMTDLFSSSSSSSSNVPSPQMYSSSKYSSSEEKPRNYSTCNTLVLQIKVAFVSDPKPVSNLKAWDIAFFVLGNKSFTWDGHCPLLFQTFQSRYSASECQTLFINTLFCFSNVSARCKN